VRAAGVKKEDIVAWTLKKDVIREVSKVKNE